MFILLIDLFQLIIGFNQIDLSDMLNKDETPAANGETLEQLFKQSKMGKADQEKFMNDLNA